MSDNPYQAPRSSRGQLQLGDQPLEFAQSPDDRNAGPSGLGGWLIVIGLKLVMSILGNASLLAVQFLPMFNDGTWQALTTPGSDGYHPLLGPVIVFEMVGNGVFLVASAVLLVMYFLKSPWFPRCMIALLVANVVFLGLDLYAASLLPQVDTNAGGATQFVRSCGAILIWVPYLLMSKRVRNTFRAPRRPLARREPRWDSPADSGANA